MSCSNNNPIEDLQDLANELFEFPDIQTEEQQKRKRDRPLKKNKKTKNQQQLKKQVKEDEGGDQQVEFELGVNNKPLGTHSIYVKTYGCSHNISDSEFMIGQLVDYGYHMVNSVEDADLVLINSCTVKNPSQDAFLNMVCKAKKIKKPVVVAGCVPQGDQNIPELSQVSALGVTQIDRVVEVVQETLKGHKIQLMSKKQLPSLDLPKIRKNKDIQIIPINAGCLGACTYCKTVFARGKLLSYDPQIIVKRVNSVVKQNVKQIWLTSQDTGAYGRDIGSNISQLLISLMQELQKHDNIMMRIGMTNPPYMLDHLKTIAHFLNHPRVFSFVHVPVQAGNNTVLTKMNREYTVQDFKKVCDYFLQHVPDVTIATDIICGFAEQTDQQFQDTMKLIQDYKFRVVNINQFYLRPGTPAANLSQLDSKVKKQRSTRLTDLFRSFVKFQDMVGKQYRVWVNQIESHKGSKHLVGHTKNYTKVIIPFDQQLLYKQIIMRITKAFEWHIQGDIIEKSPQPIKVEVDYVQRMKKDIVNENQQIKVKKAEKLEKLKETKQKLLQDINANAKVVNPINQQSKKQQSNLPKQKKIKAEEKKTDLQNPYGDQRAYKLSKPEWKYLYIAVFLFIAAGVAKYFEF